MIVDASLLVAALVDTGPDGSWAEEIVSMGSLNAPEIVLAEAGNVLRRLELSKAITISEANASLDELLRLDIALFPFEPFAERAWELRHNLTIYDAWYVALAEASQLPFATLDKRLSRVKGTTCTFVVPPPIR